MSYRRVVLILAPLYGLWLGLLIWGFATGANEVCR